LTLILSQARNHWLPQRYFQAVRFQLVPHSVYCVSLLYLLL
jgi:hypothetical protein